MTSILITGGNGYLGKFFIQKLRDDLPDSEIISIVRDSIYKFDNIREIETDIIYTDNYKNELLNAEYIIWFAVLRSHFANTKDLYKNNILPLEKVLNILKESNRIKRIIYISSISAIDNTPLSVSPMTDNTNPNPQTPYGKSKLIAEKLFENSEIPYVIFRLPFMYGAGCKPYTYLWLLRIFAKIPFVKIKIPQGQLSLLHIDDLSNIIINIIKKNILIDVSEKLLISDFQVYKIDDILSLLEKKDKKYYLTINLSFYSRVLSKIIPFSSFKYWSRVYFDNNKFVIQPSNHPIIDDYDFISLTEGLKTLPKA